MAVKYVFVTGGVVSGLGKGITAASLGRLLKARGYKVTMQKFDPYINIDPGTMNPIQHGEVFVTEDGAETDLDLGHYERFIDEFLDKQSNVTTGKIYWSVLTKERRGDFGGGTVQVIPHVTNEIKSRIYRNDASDDTHVAIIEVGVHLQLATGNDGGGSIEEEIVGFCGEGASDGVTTQHSLTAKGGNHDSFGVGAAEAHQTLVTSHLCVVACDAVVVGVTDGYDTDTGGLCLLNSQLHSLLTYQLAHAVMAVDNSRDGGLEDYFGNSIHMDHALFDALMVANHTLHAVRLDAEQVGGQQHILNGVSFSVVKAKLQKCVGTELLEQIIAPILITHSHSPLM